ncbi:MAG: hypothetical protein M1828_006974 [Chrysothrix sp. TS-e1954]|nr:MAG: hypothetical protein M1828_006974 [Chrysothrix sp. TS-e1954]
MATQTPNPFDTLIQDCANDAQRIRTTYASHRLSRLQTQTTLFNSPSHTGPTPDPILSALLASPPEEANGIDKRTNLVFWARPPGRIRDLIAECQDRLKTVLGVGVWYPTVERTHMTILEVASGRSDEVVGEIIERMRDAVGYLTDLSPQTRGGGAGGDTAQGMGGTHWAQGRSRLDTPTLVFDGTGVALTYLPSVATPLGDSAAGLADPPAGGNEEARCGGAYTHHHLRRDLYDALIRSTGGSVEPQARYVSPSAHFTIARFVDLEACGSRSEGSGGELLSCREGRLQFVRAVERVNEWLREVWSGRRGEWMGWEGGVWVMDRERDNEAVRSKGLETQCYAFAS